MKLVVAIVRPEKLNDILEALYRAEVRGLTISRVRGHGGEVQQAPALELREILGLGQAVAAGEVGHLIGQVLPALAGTPAGIVHRDGGLRRLGNGSVRLDERNRGLRLSCCRQRPRKETERRQSRVEDAGDVVQIPGTLAHEVEVLEDSVAIDVFSPVRRDWIDKTDDYFRSR